MYRQRRNPPTTIVKNDSYPGERIEEKIQRIVQNKEPITDGAPLIYTDRKDGVQPQYDIRTDRFEIAVEAMDKVAKSHVAKREAYMKVVKDEPKKDGGAEPLQATQTGS